MYHHDYFLALPEDVIAFAWSAPMRELARRIGISDVGLRKLLRSQGIVTPPQGHWNRVHAGKKVPAPPEPQQRGPGSNGRVRLDGRFRGHVAVSDGMPVGGPFASERVPEDLGALRDQERKAIGRVTVPRELAHPHPGLSEVLKREEKRLAKFEQSGWYWHRPKHDHKLAQRQLRLADALLKALAKRDHHGSLKESDTGFELHVTVGDTSLRLTIEHMTDGRKPSIRSAESQRRELPGSTPLRIEMRHVWRKEALASWEDGPKLKLERRISDIAAGIIVAAEARFRRSLAEALEEENRRRRCEEEARLRELDRLCEQRLVDLKTSGELLRQAEEIRELVERVEQAMHEDGSEACAPEQVRRWKDWALAQADVLDPVLSGQILKHLHVPKLDGG